MQEPQTWYAHGKLLITGEYLVMEGARALAVPVNRGQSLKVLPLEAGDRPLLQWMAYKPDGLWFEATYSLPDLKTIKSSDAKLAERLQQILLVARTFSPGFLDGKQSFRAETQLEFDTEFGFGSSSTLIANLAAWAGIDPFALQWKALGGSGYDIACARASSPVFYHIEKGRPVVEPVGWDPPFKDHIYFVYLGHKQRTGDSIKRFQKRAVFGPKEINAISALSKKIIGAETLKEFEHLLRQHEKIMASVLGQMPVGEQRVFQDTGVVKSLGAWGGDFVLATCRNGDAAFRRQMKTRGFQVVFRWDELILKG